MADFRDTQVIQAFNDAETRAEEWRLPKDTYGADIEEVPPEFLGSDEKEEIGEDSPESKMSAEANDTTQDGFFQDAPFKNAPPSTPDSESTTADPSPAGEADEATAGNMSQADIEALIASVNLGSSTDEPTGEEPVKKEGLMQSPPADIMSQEDIESLLTGQQAKPPEPPEQETGISPEEEKALIVDEDEQKETTRSLSEDEIANMFNAAQKVEFEPKAPETENESEPQALEDTQSVEEPTPAVEKSEAPPEVEEPPATEQSPPENEPQKTAETTETPHEEGGNQGEIPAKDTSPGEVPPEVAESSPAQQLSEELDTEALLSQDSFEEPLDESPEVQTTEDEPPSEVLESELQALLKTEESAEETQAEKDTLLSREELSAMMKTPPEDPTPTPAPEAEAPVKAEAQATAEEPEASVTEEPYAEPEKFTEEKIQALAEHTNEISQQLTDVEKHGNSGEPESQFQPGKVPGKAQDKTGKADKTGKSRSFKIPLWSEGSSWKRLGILTTAVSVIGAGIYFVPAWIQPPPPEVVKVEHPSEKWPWEKNPNQNSSVKYRIHVPGASVTLSSLVSLDSRSLNKMEPGHISQYYEKQRKRRKIQKFRFLNHVRYHKDPSDPITRMAQYDYTYKDLQGRNHLIRSLFFGVGAQVFRLGIQATTNDAEGSSSSQVSQNLNQVFQDFFGLSRTSYLPEYFLEKEFTVFTKNSRYLAQRAIMLDR